MDFEKIIAKIRAGKTWRFHGGIHPAEHKDESSESPIERLEPAWVYIVPVRQHSGDAGTIVVKTGDYVRKGDPLTKSSGRRDLPVSAPTSGTISKIGLHTAAHQSGLEDLEITITPDGKDEWRERHPIGDFRTKSPEELLSIIHNAGIAGMGGAGFPADQKIAGAVGKTHILIINGSECEPYITCDDRLMRESAAEIIEGVRILQYILKPEVAIIAIEDNKPEAAQAIKDAVRETRYPTGAARPLIRRLTGIEVGYTSRSTDFGIEMQNVATTYAIKRAVEDDEPLIERIVTVTGKNFGRKGNFIVPFGTPVRHILDKCKWHGEARNELILGGPMMGFTVPTPDVSITKTINCVFSPDSTEVMSYDNPLECIRCGRCARVCPSRLLPFALVKAAKAGDSEAIQRERIRDCIECGCCAFVCPSRIPLVRYIRIAKARIREEAAEARKKENTERLIAEKLSREEKIAAARKARIAALKEGAAPKPAVPASSTSSPAASGAAAAAAAESPAQAVKASETAAKPKSAALAAALARAKATKAKSGAALQGGNLSGASGLDAGAAAKPDVPAAAGAASGNASSENSAAGSAKSKALAAALSRAKAKKAAESASSGASESQAQKQDAPEPEPKPAANAKSAAVAAALAKARARKMAEAAGGDSGKTEPNKAADGKGASAAASGANPKKAAVAAALAKARARKAAESGAAAESAGNSQENNAQSADAKAPADAQKSADESSADPKKAALAAALARAKARKQAEAASHEADNAAEKPARSEGAEESPQSSGSSARAPAADPRKVAAALARARAKKQPAAALSSSQDKAESGDKESPSEENK